MLRLSTERLVCGRALPSLRVLSRLREHISPQLGGQVALDVAALGELPLFVQALHERGRLGLEGLVGVCDHRDPEVHLSSATCSFEVATQLQLWEFRLLPEKLVRGVQVLEGVADVVAVLLELRRVQLQQG